MRATKENARAVLELLERTRHLLAADDYDRLYYFLRATMKRLPTRAAVERDLVRKADTRSKIEKMKRLNARSKRGVLA